MQLLEERLSSAGRDSVTEDIKNRLIASFTNPEINLTAMIADSGYSTDYIRRKFRAETGMTPGGIPDRLEDNLCQGASGTQRILEAFCE